MIFNLLINILKRQSFLWFAVGLNRLASVFLVRTFYVPDEYWQSLEVAHYWKYGFGYLTWEWRTGLRSYAYPALFYMLFSFLQLFGIDSRQMLIYMPRIFHAVFGIMGDVFLYKFVKVHWGDKECAKWALFASATSHYLFYCYSRTLTNSMETVLTTVGLFYFPWNAIVHSDRRARENMKRTLTPFLWVFILNFMLRNTSVIFWIPPCIVLTWKWKWDLYLWKTVISLGIIGLMVMVIIDRLFYGYWIFTPYNFFYFNVWNNLSIFYGIHSWHWYITQGLAMLLGPHFIPFLFQIPNTFHVGYLSLIAWEVTIFSMLEHKEDRFLMPILPLCLAFVGEFMKDAGRRQIKPHSFWRKWKVHITVVFLIGCNIPLALYLGLVHQRGPIDVINHLSEVVQITKSPSVTFLLPCHATPLHSHLHMNIPTRFITCEPNIDGESDYVPEDERFYAAPMKWLNEEYGSTAHSNLPSHLVMFDILVPRIEKFLQVRNYSLYVALFHAHFTHSSTMGKEIHVYHMKSRLIS